MGQVLKVKLKLGQGFKGSEPTGCYNTGVAAVIMHSRLASNLLSKPYVVGKETDVRYDLAGTIAVAMTGRKTKAKFFKSSTAAWKEFNRLNDIIEKSNREDREEIRKAKEELKSSDPEKKMKAALTLGDYGVLNPSVIVTRDSELFLRGLDDLSDMQRSRIFKKTGIVI